MNKAVCGLLRELKNKGKVQLGNLKSAGGRLWMLSLQSLRHCSNGVSQSCSELELVAYESGRKDIRMWFYCLFQTLK